MLIGSSDTDEYAEEGVAQVSFSGNDWSMSWTPDEGEYDLTVVAIDSSGNQTEVEQGASVVEAAARPVQFGTDSSDSVSSVATDSSGNFYVSGYTGGSSPGNSSAGFDDAFVAKYDTDGNQTWVKQFSSSSLDFAESVATDSSNIYVGGVTYGTLPGNSSAGSSDAFFAKYDSNGTAQ